ncbi:MAG: NfeD family protein [Pseudomonadales bacterium]
MVFVPEYWHWLVLGMALIVIEIFLPSFTILWFGLGAIVAGVLLWIFPDLSFTLQLIVWAVASIAFTVAWFKVFKPKMTDKTTAGISHEAALGEVGLVIRPPVNTQRGMVRFTLPVVGNDEWEFVCEDTVLVGDKVIIQEISGNTLVVSKQGI